MSKIASILCVAIPLIASILCVAIPFDSHAQLNGSFKAIRSFNADSVTVKAETVGLELMYDNVGVQYYNVQSDKWRCYTTANGWYDCDGDGGGGGQVISFGDSTEIPFVNTAENDFQYYRAFKMNTLAAGQHALTFGDIAIEKRFTLSTANAGGQLQVASGAGSGSAEFNEVGITANNATQWAITHSANGALLLFQQTGTGGDIDMFADDNIRIGGEDITIDASLNDLILIGQNSVQIGSTVGAGIINLDAGTGGIDMTTSGNILLQVTGSADVTVDVNAGSSRYLIMTGLPTSSAGLPVGAVYDSISFIKIKH